VTFIATRGAAVILTASLSIADAWAQQKDKKDTGAVPVMPMSTLEPVQASSPAPRLYRQEPEPGMNGMAMQDVKQRAAKDQAANPTSERKPASTPGWQDPPTPFKAPDRTTWPDPVADNAPYTYALFDLLEYQRVGSVNALRWDALGWHGGDRGRFWLKSEGTLYPGTNTGGNADLQALYGLLITPFFDFQVGARVEQHYERGASPARVFLVVGLQGLAPGRFEVEPALFLSNTGQVSGRFTGSLELLQTQRLIIQARLETEFAIQRDDAFGVERGISDVELGLRMRYEIRREVAPYVGVSYLQNVGATRSRVMNEGGAPNQLQLVVGLRMWR